MLQALEAGDRDRLKRAGKILEDAAEASRPSDEDHEAQRRRILIDLAIAQYARGDDERGDITANAAIALAGRRTSRAR